MNYRLYTIFSLFFAVFLIGCSHSEKNKSTLRLNLYTEPPTLDPRKVVDSVSSNTLLFLFEGLTRIGFDNNPTLACARDFSISNDQKTYTFHLKDLYWSNGDPLTSYDFLYSWQSALIPSFDAPSAYKFFVIKNAKLIKAGKLPLSKLGIQTPDEKTLIVHLEHPAPYFLELLSFSTFYPVNQRIVSLFPNWADEASEHFVSNGPYILVNWEHENEIVLEKNPRYWDADTVKIENVHLAMVGDTMTEYHLFESGEIDFAGSPLSNLPTDILPTLDKEGKLIRVPFSAIYYYKINTNFFPLNNQNIRKGLSLSIDREAIVKHVMQVGHKPAAAFVPPLPNPVFNKKRELFPIYQTSEQAKSIFEKGLIESGIKKDAFPPLTIFFNSNREHQKVAEAIQQQWHKELGIRVFLEQADWKVYLNRMDSQGFEIARAAWVGEYSDPSAFLIIFKSKGDASSRGDNHTGWENLKYARLLDEADQETNPERRAEIFINAEKILIDEMPIIPIYYIEGLYIKSSRLKNELITTCGNVDFKWAYLEEER